MTRHIRLMITGLTAAAALAALVGTASAQRFVIRNSNTSFRATWASLELSNTVTANTVRCPVTLEGTFHSRTIVKVANSLVGYVTRAEVNSAGCTNGRATILNESLPWHISYQGFVGTLPTISRININLIRASFQIEPGDGRICLASTTTAAPAGGSINIGAGGVVTGISADASRNIPLRDAPGRFEFCFFGSGRFSGTASVVQLGTTTSITVTLI